MLYLKWVKIAYMKTVNERLKYAREQAKLSQSFIAKECGVKTQSVSQWESGSTKFPKAENILGVSDATGFAFRWIVTGNGPKKEGGKSPSPMDIINATMGKATPRSKDALEKLTKAANEGRLKEKDVLLLLEIADRFADAPDR